MLGEQQSTNNPVFRTTGITKNKKQQMSVLKNGTFATTVFTSNLRKIEDTHKHARNYST